MSAADNRFYREANDELRFSGLAVQRIYDLKERYRTDAAQLQSALERLVYSYRLLLAGKPVRDVEETLGEVTAALASLPSERPEAEAIAALRYWRDECTGAEPSISVFERMVEEVLGPLPSKRSHEGGSHE
jgi:hypothetical protein